LAAPAVAQSDGDGALGVVLADDEAVQLGDDFAGGVGASIGRSVLRKKLLFLKKKKQKDFSSNCARRERAKSG